MSSAASSCSRSDTSTSARAPRWCAHGGGPPEVIRADFGMDTASVLPGTGRASRRRRAGTAAAAAGRATDHCRSSKVLAGHLTLKRPSGLIVQDVVRERGCCGDRSAAQIPVSEMSDTDPMTCTSARAPSTVPASRREDTTGLPVDRDRGDWRLLGSCRNVESSLFFSPEGERGRDRARREAHAKRVCQDCPVLTECREYALAAAEPYGTWGGMSENDRRRHIRRRQRGGGPPTFLTGAGALTDDAPP